MKTRQFSAFARSLAAVLVAICLACLIPFGAQAATTTTNEAVMNDTSGVVQIKLVYVDPNTRQEYNIQSGTGFLINDSTVITCNHVVVMDSNTLATAATTFGADANVIQNNCQIQISVLRDLTITATVLNSSAEMDYAILNLSSQLYDRTYLPIRSSATVQQTEEAFTLGFPSEVEYFQDVNTYTSDDITITSGRVNKLNTINGVDYIQTSTRITSGNSGCPLVDANGAVIGICQGSTGEGFDSDYFYAIAIDQLTRSLDALGIEYTSADGTGAVTEPEATPDAQESAEPEATPAPVVDKMGLSALVSDMQAVNSDDYSEETASAFAAALGDAQAVLDSDAATQEEVDAAQTALESAYAALQPAGNNTMFIIIGVVIAIVIVLVIVIIVLTTRKGRNKASTDYVAGDTVASGAYGPADGSFAAVQQPVTPPTAPVDYAGSGAGETTVLNQGAGETTVLNQNTNFGTLTRKKTGEIIHINNASFTIGKERAKVNYCVTDNTSVSRTHATVHNRGGVAYLADNRATNGTFVNGVRLTSGQEIALKDGDVVLLADEEFVYHI
ncbi:MAG TPA: trypsin-like peptidase domain-containing protein [Candidatus Gemmiger faecigallinarum]|nr:trypsin-like peptidase domain-containing protein [Candidatus Gemmiger faecigallinarum]